MSAAMEKAYQSLRAAILSGRLKPGDRLKEREICEQLSVSRTPVREALRRLAADGLAELEPRRGGVVTRLTRREASEIFDLGALLESHAAGLAATRARPADITALRQELSEMALLLGKPEGDFRARYMTLDHEFHHQIVAIAANSRLEAMLRMVVGMPVLVNAFTSYSEADLQRSLQQHSTITDAIAAGDREWAEAAMRSHVLVSRSMTLQNFPDE